MTDEQEERAIRVLVADDQQLMRDGLVSLLALQEGIEVVGAAANGQEAVEKALELRPDVILMDVRMPVVDGVEATAQLRHKVPTCQVLVLTTFDDDEYIVEALRAGARGYLLKDIPAPDLAKAVQAAHRGIYQLDSDVASKVLQALSRPSGTEPPPAAPTVERPPSATLDQESHRGLTAAGVSSRELEVLRLVAQGATNREIAEQLVVSEGTVKNHISNILSRLGLRDRTQAALYAREQGLL
jgi:DNA-binding NarL/FixJ family response regulator